MSVMTAGAEATREIHCETHGTALAKRVRAGRNSRGVRTYRYRCPHCDLERSRAQQRRSKALLPPPDGAPREVVEPTGGGGHYANILALQDALGRDISPPAPEPPQASKDADLLDILTGRA